jgi:hypothetical protein
MFHSALFLFLALLACRSGDKPAAPQEGSAPTPVPPAAETEKPDPGHCEQQPFADSTPLPEASGAAWLTIDGKLWMVVIADSGHDGAYALIDPETGKTGETGKLPLGSPGDDIEGLAVHGDTLYGLTSDGWMRAWKRTRVTDPSGAGSGPQQSAKAFELADGPYAIGSEADGTTCKVKARCAINYEGLALAATPQGCAGFACSKGDGHVYCLALRDGRYAIDREQRIKVTREGVIGDCAFDDADRLWVGNNVFGLGEVFRVDGWSEPATARVVATNALGAGNPEVIAARGNLLYRMSDMGGAPSLTAKFRCSAMTR